MILVFNNRHDNLNCMLFMVVVSDVTNTTGILLVIVV